MFHHVHFLYPVTQLNNIHRLNNWILVPDVAVWSQLMSLTAARAQEVTHCVWFTDQGITGSWRRPSFMCRGSWCKFWRLHHATCKLWSVGPKHPSAVHCTSIQAQALPYRFVTAAVKNSRALASHKQNETQPRKANKSTDFTWNFEV